MAAVNQEDLLGSFIPDVYIGRITLESGGSTIIERDPHIDHERESLSLEESKKDSDILTVKLDLILKEKLTDDLIGSWFANQDIGKYLKINIYQSTDPDLTSLLTVGSDAIELLDTKKYINPSDIRFRLAAKTLNTKTIGQTLDKIRIKSKVKTISVKKDVYTDKSKLSSYKSTVDEDGNIIYDITYRVQFELPQSNPNHLAYFAVSTFDIVQMAQDYDLEIDYSNLRQMNGKIANDIVINDGEVVSRSYVFYDKQGKIWPGAVHQNENGGWMSKSSPSPNSVPLDRIVVSNAKVQDFRNVKEIEKLMIDFSVVNNTVFSKNLTKILSNDLRYLNKKENYFSDMLLSRDKDGDARFFFSIDMEKAIMENALFGNLIKKSTRLRTEMIRGSQIRSLKVYRQRVREDLSVNELESPKNLTVFDKNEPLEMIVSSGEKEWGSFNKINNDNAALQEVEIVTSRNLMGVRNFTGMDKTMSELTDGIYRYVVEMEVDDATVEYIEEKISNLLVAKQELESYLNVASQPAMSKYLAEVRDPHIDSPSEYAGTAGSTSGMYDADSNRFTQYFVETMNRKYSGRDRAKAPWISPVTLYCDTLDLFTGVFASKKNRLKFINSLYSFTSPKTGNPQGIMHVIKLIDNLVSVLAKSIGVTVSTSTRNFKSGSSQRNAIHSLSRSALKTFKIRKEFDQIFDSNIVKSSGLDFLSTDIGESLNYDGLRKISSENYKKRVDAETLRYFSTNNPDINITYGGTTVTSGDSIKNTNFSFLMPSRVDLKNRSTVLLGNSTKTAQTVQTAQTVKTAKIPRIVSNIDEGAESAGDSYLSLQTSLLYQTATGNSSNQNKNVFATLGDLAAGFSTTVVPITVGVVVDENTPVIKPSVIDDVSDKSTECQTPDQLVEEKIPILEERKRAESTVSFLNAMMQPAVKSGIWNLNSSKLKKANVAVLGNPMSEKYNKLSSFIDLADVSNLKTTNVSAGTTKIIQGLNRAVTEGEFKMFPNQVKALFLRSASTGIVNKDKLVNIKNFTSLRDASRAQAEISFTYEMINEVQYFYGYENNDDGVVLKRPVWKQLTEEKYNSLIGKTILCRLKPYNNPVIGLKYNKGLNPGIYDEYFLLSPAILRKKADVAPIVFTPGSLTGKIIDNIKSVLPGIDIKKITDKPIIQDIDDETEGGLINVPVKIEVVEVSAIGRDIKTGFEITDKTGIIGEISSKINIPIRDRSVSVSSDIAAEVIALDCQTENVELELTANGAVPVQSVQDAVNSAAAEQGLVVVTIPGDSSIGLVPDDSGKKCTPFGTSGGTFDVNVQVTEEEVPVFEEALVPVTQRINTDSLSTTSSSNLASTLMQAVKKSTLTSIVKSGFAN